MLLVCSGNFSVLLHWKLSFWLKFIQIYIFPCSQDTCICQCHNCNDNCWKFYSEFNEIGNIPDSKVHGANMGPNWVLLAPDGPHFGPMNLAIWDIKGSNNSLILLHIVDSVVTQCSLIFPSVASVPETDIYNGDDLLHAMEYCDL